MILRLFADESNSSQPDYEIVNASGDYYTFWTHHLDALNQYFLATMTLFDVEYSKTYPLGTESHLKNRAELAEYVANNLSDIHTNGHPERINRLSGHYTHTLKTGETIEITVSTGFNEQKPDINEARSLKI